MNNTINSAIQYWKALRNRKMLQSPSAAQYAFIGIGSHAMQNLYPVLQYLGVKLKYICCKSPEKLPLIEQRFGVIATTSLKTILDDKDVAGVFVCTSPESHYNICLQVIESGKYLFVEKPPCLTLSELETLTSKDTQGKVMVGMQKRYSPLLQNLKSHLPENDIISYTMHYRTGAYPEGNPLTDLFIHPIDMALNLFGNAEIKDFTTTERNGTMTVQMLLSHKKTKGIMELSTAYSWSCPEEYLQINTTKGEFRLEQMERLYYYPHSKKIAGIPLEKAGKFTPTGQLLAARDNFSPLITNNQLYTQGFLPEIIAFIDMVEKHQSNRSPLSSMHNTYKILTDIKR